MRYLAVLVTGLALAAAARAPAACGQTGGVEVAEGRGDSLMAAFDTRAALEAYREGLEADPDHPVLLWKASRALSNLAAETPGMEGDEPVLEEAVALARLAVAAGPGIARTHTTLATALGRYGRVVAHRHRISRAGEVVRLGREAYAEARRAIELDPADFAPFAFLGVMARELATVNVVVRAIARTFLGGYPDVDLDDSLAYLRRAKRLAPGDVTTRIELARTYLEMGEEEAAREELRAALAIPPGEALDRVEQEEARRLLAEL